MSRRREREAFRALMRRDPAALVVFRTALRFLRGAPLDGVPRTDATWTHRGTRSLSEVRPGWWSYQTKAARVGMRLSGVGAVGGTGYGVATDPGTTLDVLHVGGVGIGALAVGAASWKATDGLLRLRHNRDYVWPLHVVLTRALSLPEGTRPRHYLDVPEAFNEITGDAIRVELPAEMAISDTARSAVQTAIRTKLALQDAQFVWHLSGADHHLVVRQSPRPPEKALFASPEIRAAVESAAADAPVIGVSHSGKIIAHSIESDSPHTLVVMGTGGGKSVLLRTLAAQLMHHGAEVVLLDYKQVSQPWMRRIRGIRYARAEAAIHEALLYIGEIAEQRRTLTAKWIDEGGDPEKGPCPYITHRLLVFFEEINSTLPDLKRYWERVRGKDDPKESPAITAYFKALNMGRSEKVHFVSVGQSGKEYEIGPRNAYGLRILGRFDKKTWNLVAEAGTAPKNSGTVGRVQVVINGVAHETQVMFFEPEEAIEWATSGVGRTASRPAASAPEADIARPIPQDQAPRVPGWAPGSPSPAHTATGTPSPRAYPTEPHATGASETGPNPTVPDPATAPLPSNVVPFRRRGTAPETAGETAEETAGTSAPDLVNMAQASQDKGRGIIPMKHATIRRARVDDPEFPPPDGKDARGRDAWLPETLVRWHANRPRTAAKKKMGR